MLDEEMVAARTRTLHRSRALADFAAALGNAQSDEERHATRRRFARPLAAWGEVHRRIWSFGVFREDGSLATGSLESAIAMADHWAPSFGAGGDIDDRAADRLLRHSVAFEAVSALLPFDFDEFVAGGGTCATRVRGITIPVRLGVSSIGYPQEGGPRHGPEVRRECRRKCGQNPRARGLTSIDVTSAGRRR